MKPEKLSTLIASLAEIIARLKYVHYELQRLEKEPLPPPLPPQEPTE